MLGQDEKYSSFKKNHGPPFYQFNPRFGPLDHDPYLTRRGIPTSSMRMFEPKVRFHDVAHHWRSKCSIQYLHRVLLQDFVLI